MLFLQFRINMTREKGSA